MVVLQDDGVITQNVKLQRMSDRHALLGGAVGEIEFGPVQNTCVHLTALINFALATAPKSGLNGVAGAYFAPKPETERFDSSIQGSQISV